MNFLIMLADILNQILANICKVIMSIILNNQFSWKVLISVFAIIFLIIAFNSWTNLGYKLISYFCGDEEFKREKGRKLLYHLRDFNNTINEIKELDDIDSKKIVRDIAFELRDLFVFINSESQKNNDEEAQIIKK